MANWYIVSSSRPNLAIQGGATAGSGLTLEALDKANASQQWTVQPQVANGYAGIALINAATALSVTFNGEHNQLVMESYSPISVDQDAWLFFPQGGANTFRIVWPKDTSWCWEDNGAHFAPGDSILLWNDQAPNSQWSLVYQ